MYSSRSSASTTPRRSAYTGSRAYTSGLSSSFGGGLSSPTRSPTYSSSYTSSSWFPSSTYNSYSTSGYSSYNGKAEATSPVHHRRTAATSTLGTTPSSYRSRSYTNDDTAITSPTRVTRTYRGARSQTDLPLSEQRGNDTSGCGSVKRGKHGRLAQKGSHNRTVVKGY